MKLNSNHLVARFLIQTESKFLSSFKAQSLLLISTTDGCMIGLRQRVAYFCQSSLKDRSKQIAKACLSSKRLAHPVKTRRWMSLPKMALMRLHLTTCALLMGLKLLPLQNHSSDGEAKTNSRGSRQIRTC